MGADVSAIAVAAAPAPAGAVAPAFLSLLPFRVGAAPATVALRRPLAFTGPVAPGQSPRQRDTTWSSNMSWIRIVCVRKSDRHRTLSSLCCTIMNGFLHCMNYYMCRNVLGKTYF